MINIPANVLICDGGDIVGPKKEDADARQRFFGAVGDEELLLTRPSRLCNCAVTLQKGCGRRRGRRMGRGGGQRINAY